MGEYNNTEEISLVDLLAVVIRYRRMIIGVTLVSVIIAAAVVFFLPGYKFRQSPETTEYKAVMTCRLTPGVFSFMREQNPQGLVIPAFNDSGVILKALKTTGINEIAGISLDEKDEGRLLNLIYRRFVENDDIYTVESLLGKKEEQENSEYQVSVRMKDGNLAGIFLDNLVNGANDYLKTTLKPSAEDEIYSYEAMASMEYPRAVIEENLMETTRRYAAAQRFLAGEEFALYSIHTPYVIDYSKNTTVWRNRLIKQAVVTVVVVFIFVILLSFILNWVDNVRHDPESMEKLRKAIKRERLR